MAMDRIRYVGKEWDDIVYRGQKKISIGDELIDTVLTKGVEEIPKCPGCYSTEKTVLIGGRWIQREGLQAVYCDEEVSSSTRGGTCTYIVIDCFYENGDWLSFTAVFTGVKKGRLDEICKAIRRLDESIPIYHHLYWNTVIFIPMFPYRKYISQQSSVNKMAMDELSQICQDNHFWKVACKSRMRWDGMFEVEFSINGTVITWILYLILMVFMVIAFFSLNLWKFVGACVAALCYYVAVHRTANKIVLKATKSLNCECSEVK